MDAAAEAEEGGDLTEVREFRCWMPMLSQKSTRPGKGKLIEYLADPHAHRGGGWCIVCHKNIGNIRRVCVVYAG